MAEVLVLVVMDPCHGFQAPQPGAVLVLVLTAGSVHGAQVSLEAVVDELAAHGSQWPCLDEVVLELLAELHGAQEPWDAELDVVEEDEDSQLFQPDEVEEDIMEVVGGFGGGEAMLVVTTL